MNERLEPLTPPEVEVVRSLRDFATEAGNAPQAYPSAKLLLFKASLARREEKAAAARRLDLVLQLATLALTLGGVALAVLARWPLPRGMSFWILAGLAFPAALWSPLRFTALLVISASLALPTPARAADDSDLPLDAATRNAVLEGVAGKISARYVLADVGARVAQEVRARAARGEFGELTTARPFCERVTAVLVEASHDKHLKLVYSVRPRTMPKAGEEDSPAERARTQADAAFVNFGFHKAERLRGNIGYLEFERFMDPSIAGETAAAAMAFLAHTDALILDLRGNGGGTPMMVAFLASYLFSGPVHLNDIASRVENEAKQFWTLPYVPGARFDGKDVYVLTSPFTFSGAEELAYDLKSLKRATLVGETTRGGANPGSFEMLNEHFAVFVPSGRAINPITKTNWEGTGVTPDIAVPADQALKTAYLDALEKAARRTTDPRRQESFREWIARAKKELEELKTKGAK